MTTRGIIGVKRGKTTFRARSKTTDTYPTDKGNRWFVAERPNQLWKADNTYVATWQGFTYVALVTDVLSCKIVGWSVSFTCKADMLPLQALKMAAWMLSGDLTEIVHQPDPGSNYVSLTYGDRIVELGGITSVSSKGDNHDKSMAEFQLALVTTELIKKQRSWRSVERAELATLGLVWCFNNQRLKAELDYRTTAEIEVQYCVENTLMSATATHENNWVQDPGQFPGTSGENPTLVSSEFQASEVRCRLIP